MASNNTDTDSPPEHAKLATSLTNLAITQERQQKETKAALRSLGFRYADGTISRLDESTDDGEQPDQSSQDIPSYGIRAQADGGWVRQDEDRGPTMTAEQRDETYQDVLAKEREEGRRNNVTMWTRLGLLNEADYGLPTFPALALHTEEHDALHAYRAGVIAHVQALNTEAEQLRQRVASLEKDNAELRDENVRYRNGHAAMKKQYETIIADNKLLQREVDRLGKDNVADEIDPDATRIKVRIQINGIDYLAKKGLLAAFLRQLSEAAAREFEFGALASGTFLFDKTVVLEDAS